MENGLENDYPLIPMSLITDEAREIAVRWGDEYFDGIAISEKHKLASDIMNYARRLVEGNITVKNKRAMTIKGMPWDNGLRLECKDGTLIDIDENEDEPRLDFHFLTETNGIIHQSTKSMVLDKTTTKQLIDRLVEIWEAMD